MSCGVGCRCSLDPALLCLWCRPAAEAPIGPLAWECPYDVCVVLKRQKKKKKIPPTNWPSRWEQTIHCFHGSRSLETGGDHEGETSPAPAPVTTCPLHCPTALFQHGPSVPPGGGNVADATGLQAGCGQTCICISDHVVISLITLLSFIKYVIVTLFQHCYIVIIAVRY